MLKQLVDEEGGAMDYTSSRRLAGPWRVLVAAPEPSTSTLFIKVIESMSGVKGIGVVRRGEDALAIAQTRRCDLLILDLDIGLVGGEQVLAALRARRLPIDVIVLGVQRDPLTVRSMMQHGVIDYLLKPCTPDRLRQSLRLFKKRAAALSCRRLDQETIDRACTFGALDERLLADGLTWDRVVLARNLLESAPRPVSAADLGQRMGVSRVTARRYLEHLVASDIASFELDAEGNGRPRKLYQAALI